MGFDISFGPYSAGLTDASTNTIKNILTDATDGIKMLMLNLVNYDVSCNVVWYTGATSSFGTSNITPTSFNLNITVGTTDWPQTSGVYTNLGSISFNTNSRSYSSFYDNVLYTKLLRQCLIGIGITVDNYNKKFAREEYLMATDGDYIPVTNNNNKYYLSKTQQTENGCTYPGLPNEILYDDVTTANGITESRTQIYMSNIIGGILRDLGKLSDGIIIDRPSFDDWFPQYPSELLDGKYSCTDGKIDLQNAPKLSKIVGIIPRYLYDKNTVVSFQIEFVTPSGKRPEFKTEIKMNLNDPRILTDLTSKDNRSSIKFSLNKQTGNFSIGLPENGPFNYEYAATNLIITIKNSSGEIVNQRISVWYGTRWYSLL